MSTSQRSQEGITLSSLDRPFGERGKQSSESRIMAHIQEICVFEACHNARSKLLLPEEVGEEFHNQRNRGREKICLPSTTPSAKYAPLSEVDRLGGGSLRGSDPVHCLPGKSGLTDSSPDNFQA